VLQELQSNLQAADIRGAIRERLREYSDTHDKRSESERTDSAWRLVQNILADELAELNSELGPDARITEKDRLALPDGSQAIDVMYRGQKFSIVRPKDRRHLSLVDPTAGSFPIEHVGSKVFIAGEPIAAALPRAIARLVERATAGVNTRGGDQSTYMTLDLPSASAVKVESALNLARQNGYRFVESYKLGKGGDRRVFVFERAVELEREPSSGE